MNEWTCVVCKYSWPQNVIEVKDVILDVKMWSSYHWISRYLFAVENMLTSVSAQVHWESHLPSAVNLERDPGQWADRAGCDHVPVESFCQQLRWGCWRSGNQTDGKLEGLLLSKVTWCVQKDLTQQVREVGQTATHNLIRKIQGTGLRSPKYV